MNNWMKCVCSACAAACFVRPVAAWSQQPLAITHATVEDASSAAPRRDQTIVVRGNRIVAVGPFATTMVPAGARLLDANHRFVIPGLWDMHVHTDIPRGRDLLAAYVVNGVTGIRDMGGDWVTLSGWRRDIAAGRLVGPRMVVSGPYIDGNNTEIAHIQVKTGADSRAAVDSLKRLGVDFVKIHSGLTRETYFGAARRARELGMPFGGHVPRVVSAIEASDAGQRSIEHLLTIPTPCSPADSVALAPRFPIQRVFGPCTSLPLDPIFAAFVRNHTWVTPTYVAQVEVGEWPLRSLPGDAYAKFIPDTLRKFVAMIFPMPDSIPPDAYVVGREMLRRRIALAGAMQRAGVRLLAGTDAPLRNSPPGFGLAGELAMLEEGGLTPREVLKVATWEPASFFAALDSAGTVAAGKLADLVILDADPLADVANYRHVWAVVANGRLYDAAERGRILARLTAAGRPAG